MLTRPPSAKSESALTPMKRVLWSLPLAAALALAGCASVKYTYGNQTFSSADEALAQQKADLAGILDAVAPVTSPVHGKALVALPSREELRRHYIRTSGNVGQLRPEQLDYVCSILDNDQEMLSHALEKTRLFDQVTVTRVGDPAVAAIEGNDYLIYRDIDGWFIQNPKTAPKKVVIDADAGSGLPRTRSFLSSLEERARSLAP